ncbi:MAG: DUF2231 domain-containing protein [Terriglobales bacterium]
MFQFPPIPSWEALHPLIIHFPIVLLLVAPLFILIGALLPARKARPALAAGLLLMIMGTASVFVAAETGEAAGEIAERNLAIKGVLEQHEELAEQTEVVFSVLTVVFALLLLGPILLLRAPARMTTTVLPLVFLLFYSAGALLLINTAHQGGRLVHEFGVRALAPASPPPAAAARDAHHDNN